MWYCVGFSSPQRPSELSGTRKLARHAHVLVARVYKRAVDFSMIVV